MMHDELAHAVLERRTTTLNRPDGRLLRDLRRYLVAIHQAQSFDPGMETIWERLQRSLPALEQGLERIEMVRGETAYIPMIIRRGVRLGINELSDGYQAVLVIMFDLMVPQEAGARHVHRPNRPGHRGCGDLSPGRSCRPEAGLASCRVPLRCRCAHPRAPCSLDTSLAREHGFAA